MHQSITQERDRFFLIPHLLENLGKYFVGICFSKSFAEFYELHIVRVLDLSEVLQYLHHMNHAGYFRGVNQIAELQQHITDVLCLLLQCGREYFYCFGYLCTYNY